MENRSATTIRDADIPSHSEQTAIAILHPQIQLSIALLLSFSFSFSRSSLSPMIHSKPLSGKPFHFFTCPPCPPIPLFSLSLPGPWNLHCLSLAASSLALKLAAPDPMPPNA